MEGVLAVLVVWGGVLVVLIVPVYLGWAEVRRKR